MSYHILKCHFAIPEKVQGRPEKVQGRWSSSDKTVKQHILSLLPHVIPKV